MKRITSGNWRVLNHALSIGLCLLFVQLLQPARSQAGESADRKLRVALFYNKSLFKDSVLCDQTGSVFTNQSFVDLSIIDYADSTEFYAKFRTNVLEASNQFDLVLGPTDSESLRTLDRAVSAKIKVPFLAPFITTPPADYGHIELISASPEDGRRVEVAVAHFAKYMAPRALGCLYVDDAWGQGISREFRNNLAREGTTVFLQPASENEVESSTGVRGRKNNGQLYTSFLGQMQKQGATLIAVALLESTSINQFLGCLENLNKDSWIKFKPTILLLNPPHFDASHVGRGVLAEYVREFRIAYVRDAITARNVPEILRGILPHLDACNVILATARNWPPHSNDPAGAGVAVQRIRDFYAGEWTWEEFDMVETNLMTGFHVANYTDSEDLEIVRAQFRAGKVVPENTARFFESGFWQQLFWREWFFFSHHRSLWHPLLASAFVVICFGFFLHMVWSSTMKGVWLILRTRSFWLLFGLNFGLTYCSWVLSINFGLFADRDWFPPLLLASLCPSALTALRDLIKRFFPMFNINGVFQILNEMNDLWLERIGKEELKRYQKWLSSYPLGELKQKFFETLFLEVDSDSLRNRFRERLKQRIKDAREDGTGISKEDQQRLIYAESMLQLIGYISKSNEDLEGRLVELFPPAEPAAEIVEPSQEAALADRNLETVPSVPAQVEDAHDPSVVTKVE
jgi:hypothetical protein